MPDHDSLITARRMLEYCRFSYKAYAQSCEFPMDPFYESWGPGLKMLPSARDRLLEHIHDAVGTQGDERKFDPVAYKLNATPNPQQGVVYRGGTDDSYILFQPRDIDLGITSARGFNLRGEPVDGGHALVAMGGHGGELRCCYFQGRTGMTQTHPRSGWTTWLGAVLYDASTQEAVIVFRGSRSGDGTRALASAQTKSRGSPDWVTDMNHLKSVTVAKWGGSSMSCGFFYAYESARISLTAALLAACGGKPKTIYVTGHSLGGALAQNAYVDLVCGELARDTARVSEGVPKYCFPISAPPICLGKKAQYWVGFNANGSNVHHYFCPRDAVHASPLVDSSKFTRANAVVAFGTHPLTDPFHIGSEVALPCDVNFPDAHEPDNVWLGMHGGVADHTFWPTFKLNVVADLSSLTDLRAASLKAELREARARSHSPAATRRRATQWMSVIKEDERRKLSLKGIDLYDSAEALLDDARTRSGSMHALTAKNAIKNARKQLIDGGYKDPAKHSASSSAYYTMLLGLAVKQVLLDTS